MDSYSLTGGVIATPRRILTAGCLSVKANRIVSLSKREAHAFDLGGASMVYPALINVHDHLRGNYLPRVGPKTGSFYLNWLPWDNDLKSSPTYSERSNLSVENLYFLSAYKNLFSGVTTVNDHFPHELNRELLPRLPIRAFQEYCLAHECSSFDLKWGDGIEIEHKRALERDWPFITHLEEGFDSESQDGVGVLDRLGALDSHCLLIHCIGFSDADIKRVAEVGASVSWCPASNLFMFNATCKIRKLLKAGVNISIGTDSTHTGSVNLMAEMRLARETYRNLYGEELDAKLLTDMVTVNPAKAFRMADRLGSLEEGKLADLLVLKARKDDAYENLASAAMEDIELLVMEGRPLYGEERFTGLFGDMLPLGYTIVKVGGRRMFVIGDPSGLYAEIRKKVGFGKKLDYLPFEAGA
ncbi:MAG: hydrolase [Treponema sp. GWB1_62_6]|nr:MAG: hydrolase [Treponema sp. GWA1_62_8]OHE66402.1 MAG: hydrolase [Treponema sp. GWC1_61_84]OHE70691.1 MAG: hydrolase [Treponema sp. GWB1_62_6]OHE74270.1 MAG: hydrolase [Treponema sp. RIFOXYC1_FULL_61_9]